MQDIQQDPIAIIGMGCRFPGANNPSEFWQLLRAGKSAIREIPPERWRMDDLYDADPTSPGKTISRWGGFIDQAEHFDWRMFHIPPREARYIDPQHRLLLEVAWEALEDAGLPLASVAGSRTSVTIGVIWDDYLRMQSRRWSQLDGYSLIGNLSSFAANRLSYFFDLKGPSMSLDAGCTSSLASLSLACQNLLTGEATLALAGGVNLILSPESMIMMSKAGLLSPDGSCKALDATANGTVRGEGAGIVVLKRLSQVRPQDRVYAVIRGITLGHNGHNEWIMGTSAAAQEMLLRNAYERADVDPAEVDYVELHGSGFLRGDPVEAKALGAVLGASERRHRPCFIGSLKTNIGNLDAASGIASVIKVALSLYHRELPPTLNLQTINPAISLEELRLAPQCALGTWPEKAGVPLAAVNTLSFTGANGHAILAAASDSARIIPPVGSETALTTAHILPLSAGSKQALATHAANLRDFLLSQEALHCSWQDICYTASECRTHHPYRMAVVARSAQEGAEALDDFVHGRSTPSLKRVSQETVPGQKGALFFLHALSTLYTQGYTVNWSALYQDMERRVVSLPTYPWQRVRLWPDWLDAQEVGTPPEWWRENHAGETSGVVQAAAREPFQLLHLLTRAAPGMQEELLRAYITDQVIAVLDSDPASPPKPGQQLFTLGMDSLTATQLINRLQASLQQPLSATAVFDHPTIESLAAYLVQDVFPARQPVRVVERASSDAHAARFLTKVENLSETEAEALLLEKLASLENLPF